MLSAALLAPHPATATVSESDSDIVGPVEAPLRIRLGQSSLYEHSWGCRRTRRRRRVPEKAVGDALTSGNDANVLGAALAGELTFTACGDLHDAIGAQLIAADGYGDTNHPAARCAALRSAPAPAQLHEFFDTRAGAVEGFDDGAIAGWPSSAVSNRKISISSRRRGQEAAVVWAS